MSESITVVVWFFGFQKSPMVEVYLDEKLGLRQMDGGAETQHGKDTTAISKTNGQGRDRTLDMLRGGAAAAERGERKRSTRKNSRSVRSVSVPHEYRQGK